MLSGNIGSGPVFLNLKLNFNFKIYISNSLVPNSFKGIYISTFVSHNHDENVSLSMQPFLNFSISEASTSMHTPVESFCWGLEVS